ncbi:hypothetical protein NUW58_g10749 [Xylaria curta]|uniref:Uncharacterized protein n=1 Tax=Xylaria curta TaxID=42375 RepID=A0ACC1MIL7_9PEZI|nr:hypothetical protein NUW58_g10749 [Xylaria curta]
MWPLSQQAVIVALHSSMTVLKTHWHSPQPDHFRTCSDGRHGFSDGPSLEDSKKYLAESLELVQAVKPEDVNGKEGSTVTAMMGAGAEANMKALDYVVGYLQPNIYFHLTTTYDILRNKGAAIGKKDFLQSFVRLA